jgi:hypothetical protein
LDISIKAQNFAWTATVSQGEPGIAEKSPSAIGSD